MDSLNLKLKNLKPQLKIKILFVLFLVLVANSVEAETILEKKVSLGGQLTGGNTQIQSLHVDFFLNHNQKWHNEWTLKGSLDRETSAGLTKMQKSQLALRYGQSLSRQFYRFYRFDLEHDYLQNIGLRLIPTIGWGYWFSDRKKYQFNIEAALGYQRQYSLSGLNPSQQTIVRLSSDFIWSDLSNNFDFYIDTGNWQNFRLINEIKYSLKMNQHYALKWSLKDEYNNQPTAGVQKNDIRTTIALEYSFKQIVK